MLMSRLGTFNIEGFPFPGTILFPLRSFSRQFYISIEYFYDIRVYDIISGPPLGLYVIIRPVSLGRAGTTREHCGDQGKSGAPGGQVEGPVESTGTCGYENKNHV